MFSRSDWYQDLKKQLRAGSNVASALDGKTLGVLFQVELGLYLLTSLNMNDEPVVVLPSVLSGIPFPALSGLNATQQQSIAIARLLLSAYSAETGWVEALRQYSQLPKELCTFQIQDVIPFDEQLIGGCQDPAYQGGARHQVYQQTLSKLPNWAENRRSYPKEGMVGPPLERSGSAAC
jgi:hypothetical protein